MVNIEGNILKSCDDSSHYLSRLTEIIGKSILDDLSEVDKNELLSQIKKLDELGLLNNGIKIRVKPGFIRILRKILGVHDIKGGAYRGNTVYLGDREDLFNEDLIVHESIHVKQQAELSKSAFVGFVKWLFYSVDSMKKYKKKNTDNKNLNYEATIMIPTELEAYAYSDDPFYLIDREKRAFKEYEKLENQQKVLKLIENRNYKHELYDLKSSGSGNLGRLEEIMKNTRNSDWVLYIFNNVDEVNQLLKIEELLETKIKVMDDSHWENIPVDLIISQREYRHKLSKKMETLKDEYKWELNKFNLSYLFDNDVDGVSVEHLKEKLGEIRQKIKEYKRTPAKFWLEDAKHRDKVFSLGF